MSGFRIGTNVASLGVQRHLLRSSRELSSSSQRLSSGLRINSAADDAAGLAISEKLRAQIRGLSQAQRNANDGISLLQTAEGALNETSDMLIRMRELAVQSANGTLGSEERRALNNEFSALVSEVDRIASTTEFNGRSLLAGTVQSVGPPTGYAASWAGMQAYVADQYAGDSSLSWDNTLVNDTDPFGDGLVHTEDCTGTLAKEDVTYNMIRPGGTVAFCHTSQTMEFGQSAGNPLSSYMIDNPDATAMDWFNALGGATGATTIALQVGLDNGSADTITLSINASDAASLGVDSLSITSVSGARSVLATIDSAISTVAANRGGIGAAQNRLQSTINNLGISRDSCQAV